jgi:hypothetical protein
MATRVKVNSTELKQAVELYTSFREAKPKRVDVVEMEHPSVVMVIGHLESVDYRTTHGGKLQLYRHDFARGSRPLLCVSADGEQLVLVGGRYTFTEDGIVDHDKDGNEIRNQAHGTTL